MSREIDKQIEENIFKKEFKNKNGRRYFIDGTYSEDNDRTPDYSTNIQDALLVMEKVRKLYPIFIRDSVTLTKYKVTFGVQNAVTAEHKDLPMAISLAALKIKEEYVN